MKLLLSCFIIFILSGCARHHIVTGMIPPIPAPQYTDTSVIKAFAEETAQAATGRRISLVTEGSSVAKTEKVLTRLVTANGSSHPYHAFIIADDTNNAFTDGRAIYLHAQLYSQLRDENDIAAVVSHELSHISCGHTSLDREEVKKRDALVQVASAFLGVAAAMAQKKSNPYASQQQTTNTMNQATKLANTIGSASFVRPYQRDQEREADEVGLMMAARAGYDPEKIYDFWIHADELLGPSAAGLLSTHPSNDQRAMNLESVLPIAREYYKCAALQAAPKTKQAKKGPKKRDTIQQQRDDERRYCEEVLSRGRCSQDYCLDYRVQ